MTRAFDPDEPVFKKSRWGTNRYVYNADNPVGLTLIVVSVVFAVVMLLLMSYRAGPFAPDEPVSRWTPPETGGTHRSPPVPATP